VGDLPTRERSIFLKEVLRDDNPAVSDAAVWQAGILPRPARGALSDLALKWLPNVVDRARGVLTLRSGAVSRERPRTAFSGAIWPRTRSDTRLSDGNSSVAIAKPTGCLRRKTRSIRNGVTVPIDPQPAW
jgi:hypothetical protein